MEHIISFEFDIENAILTAKVRCGDTTFIAHRICSMSELEKKKAQLIELIENYRHPEEEPLNS